MKKSRPKCSSEGCESGAIAKGLCRRHYNRKRMGWPPEPTKRPPGSRPRAVLVRLSEEKDEQLARLARRLGYPSKTALVADIVEHWEPAPAQLRRAG